MENGIMANGDQNLFEEMQTSYDDIGRSLENPELNTREVLKKFLAANRIIMAFFIGTSLEDHKKVEKMWVGYKLMSAVFAILGVSITTLIWALITGQVELIFK